MESEVNLLSKLTILHLRLERMQLKNTPCLRELSAGYLGLENDRVLQTRVRPNKVRLIGLGFIMTVPLVIN